MRNLLFSILLLGGLITGTVILMQHIEKKRGIRHDYPSAGSPAGSPVSSGVPSVNTNTHSTTEKRPETNRSHSSAGTTTNGTMVTVKTGRIQEHSGKADAGDTGVVMVPHTPLLAAPSAASSPVTLLYRGNSVHITGPVVSNFLPCRALNTRGWVAAPDIELTTRRESARFRHFSGTPGSGSARTALLGARNALRRGKRLDLVRLVFTTLDIRYSGWDQLRFRVPAEDLRNRPAGRPLSSAPYTRSLSFKQLAALCRKYLAGSGSITRLSDKRYVWIANSGSTLTVVNHSGRWFLERISLRMSRIP